MNASYDHLRRRATRPSTSLDGLPELAERGDCFAAAETTRLVESCLAGLTPRYRTALVLKDLHGLSTSEIAQVMDLHQGAARVLVHRARSAFRKAFRSASPAGAGGASALGLAAFLPELPVPGQLQMPPAIGPAPPASGQPPVTHPACPSPGAEQPLLPGGPAGTAAVGAPLAAATTALSAPASAAILAGAGLKAAVAVLATVVVAGGGIAAGHYAGTPVAPYAAHTATQPTAAEPADDGGVTWPHGQMIRERLQAAGLTAAGFGSGLPGGGMTAGGSHDDAARSRVGTVAGGGGGEGAGGAVVTGGTAAGEAAGSGSGGEGSGPGATSEDGSGETAESGGTGGTDANGAATGDGTDTSGGTGGMGGEGTDSGGDSDATSAPGGTGTETGSGGGGN